VDSIETAPADLVELGAVRGAYGVKGWARVAPFVRDGMVLPAARTWWVAGDNGPPAPVVVTAVRRHGALLVAKWCGWDDPEAVEAIKGRTVAVARSEFPPPAQGEFYAVDLIGAKVVNRQGVALGKVSAVRDNHGQSLLEVQCAGAPLLIPLVENYVDSVQPRDGIVRVDWQPEW
jgi:16S rRNA processing protein RimM